MYSLLEFDQEYKCLLRNSSKTHQYAKYGSNGFVNNQLITIYFITLNYSNQRTYVNLNQSTYVG